VRHGPHGTLYAFEQEGVLPDLVVLGKGLGAGYQPIGAVLARAHIAQRLRDGSGAFQHGHTYGPPGRGGGRAGRAEGDTAR
jgi:adenosylmethionine-8-amino-7-oxononanoate aminotransferase